MTVRRYRGTISLPPGKNRQHEISPGRPVYRTSNGRSTITYSKPHVYNGKRHRAWEETSLLELRMQGWRILPQAEYAATLEITIYGPRDVDNPLEAILDLIQTTIGVDDRCIDDLRARRVDASAEEARTELRLIIWER